MRHRALLTGLSWILLAAGVAGCGGGIEAVGTQPQVLVADGGDGEDQISGQVSYLEDFDCFVLRGTANEILGVLVWPDGTKQLVGGSPRGVVVPSTGEVRVGQSLTGVGDVLVADPSNDEQPKLPAECLADAKKYIVVDRVSSVSAGPSARIGGAPRG